MRFIYVACIFLGLASCGDAKKEALLHPFTDRSSPEDLTDQLDYLQSIVNDQNRNEVIDKALLLLKQAQWPDGYEKEINHLALEADIIDSTSLANLMHYYKLVDNQFLLKRYAQQSIAHGFISPETLSSLSYNFYAINKLDSAAYYIDEAIRLGDNADNWRLKAYIQLAKKDTVATIASFIRSNQLHRLKQKDALTLAKLLYETKNYDQALSILRAHDISQDTLKALIYLKAKIHTDLNNRALAINTLQQLPIEDHRRFMALVDLYNDEKRYNEVLMLCDSVLPLSAYKNEVLLAKARAQEKKWYLRSAIWTYQQILKNDSTDEVVIKELEKVKGKSAYLRRIKELDSKINIEAE